MTILAVLSIFVFTYALFAIVFVVATVGIRFLGGVEGYNRYINNRFAGKKSVIVFEIYSYLVLLAWLTTFLSFADLFTIQKFAQFRDYPYYDILTWFGPMSYRQGDIHFFFLFFNILGIKAALNMVEVARLVRQGRVRIHKLPYGFLLWTRETLPAHIAMIRDGNRTWTQDQ